MLGEDRQSKLQHLAVGEGHVAGGEIHLAKQEALIVDLKRDGHDSADARAILTTLRQTQANHVLDRGGILKELRAGQSA